MVNINREIVLTALLSIFLFLSIIYFGDYRTIFENLDIFNTTVTTILGLLFAILAILYTFESQLAENEAVKELKELGKYRDIVKVFYVSVGLIGIVWIFTFALSLFEIYGWFGTKVSYTLLFFTILGFVVVIMRLIRCFLVFYLFNLVRIESE